MTGEGIQQQDLVISKLLRQDIEKYKSLFPHVSAAIQLLSNNVGGVDKHPTKGDTTQYIYTNSKTQQSPVQSCTFRDFTKARERR